MRRETLRLRPHRGPLSYRAALRRTFGGMTACLALLLLSLGAYLIENQLTDPVGAHPAGLLSAAVFIATGLILLSYLVHPGARPRPRPVVYQILDIPMARQVPAAETPVSAQTTLAPDACDENRGLSLTRRYVDHARIRL